MDEQSQKPALDTIADTEHSKAKFDNQSELLSVASDVLPLSIVFETSFNLDLYVLYVNYVSVVLWGRFVSFFFSTPDTNFLVMSGMVLGWACNLFNGASSASAMNR